MLKSSGDSLVCDRCGSPFPAGQAVTYVFLAPAETASADHIYCSTHCRDRAVSAWLAMPICAACGNKYEPSTGPGRPSVYCSPGCRKAHERVLSRAMHSLARDRFPADDDRLDAIQADLDDAQALARAWSDDGPALIQEPSPRARAALAGRVNKLERMRDRSRERAGRKAAQRRWAEEQRRWADEQAQVEGADAGWRRELLSGPGGD